jgi:hypothetical protein
MRPLRALFAVAAVLFIASSLGAQAPAGTSPSEGYTIHVLAPHLVDGRSMGPYHHYCKVLSGDPRIVCLIYESTDPNAMLVQVEYIMAKSLTRPNVSRSDWNKYWHDHTVEIGSGRVQVLDLPPDKARDVANLVSTTDGLIYNVYFKNGLPSGRSSVAQAVGHKPLSPAAYRASGGR